jgi:hypothetical protein
MIRCYVIHHQQAYGNTWDKEINEIKTLSPDRIILECLEEQDWSFIFSHLLDKLLPWVREHNKVIQVLAPDIGNVTIANVEVYPTVGVMLMQSNDVARWLNQSHEAGLEERYLAMRFPKVQYPLLFTCYANKYSPERMKLIDALVRENLVSEGLVTCHFTFGDWKHHDGSKIVDPVEPDFELHSKPEYKPSILPKSFFKGLFDVIPESRYADNEFMMTEKTIKSIINCKPFLVLSCKGYHKEFLVKRMGYQLYDEMFDYSFDSCDNVDDRIEGIIQNIKRLRDKLSGPAEYANKYYLLVSLSRKLQYNRAKFFDIFYDPDKIIPECLQFVRKTNDYTFYGNTDGPLFHHMRQMNWIKL